MKVPETKPLRMALYNVLDFGAEPFVVPFTASSTSMWLQIDIRSGLEMAKDNTEAIQKALDKAASEGGGIVYLPGGRYKVLRAALTSSVLTISASLRSLTSHRSSISKWLWHSLTEFMR